jgi:hypothetical protein
VPTWVSGAKGEHVKVSGILAMADPMAQTYFLRGLKLPRFRGVMLDLGDYGSVVTASIAAS